MILPKLSVNFIKKYAIINRADILPHLEKSLNELKKDIDFLINSGGVPREIIINTIIEELSNNDQNQFSSKEEFLQKLKELHQGGKNALIPIKELRKQMNLSKEEFDKIAMELSKENKIILHHHDFPSSLSESQKNQLVYDPKNDIYYIGIAIKKGANV